MKLLISTKSATFGFQPPLGGCVLKLLKKKTVTTFLKPAAFRRLCVET